MQKNVRIERKLYPKLWDKHFKLWNRRSKAWDMHPQSWNEFFAFR